MRPFALDESSFRSGRVNTNGTYCMHVSFGGNVWPFYVGRPKYRFTYYMSLRDLVFFLFFFHYSNHVQILI